ncbi:hypothetical protein Q4543_23405 [Salipiger sp. 1_MG-2023]|uniref:DUF6880 family protein n=1 Tax=Salipiger sp. 1_MG-2023 TaxID=3062665 RepID=UPI0026E3BB17|nr:DUF6880 family protein [Salipiger sp. 1_MG-2023]MDO6588439.1 hypothetical protein [Salipiger sp. 1_MG-2023]
MAIGTSYPIALWRAMIGSALTRQRKGRYGHAARDLTACANANANADAAITDYGSHSTHATYTAALAEAHPRKASFWAQFP